MPKICKYESCSNAVFSGGYCHRHYARSPIKTTTQKKKTTKTYPRIRRESQKQAIQNREYTRLRSLFFKEPKLCIGSIEGCTKIATEIHHSKGRYSNLLNISTWIPLCRNCHNWAENHPKEAKEIGLSDYRLNKKDESDI